MKLKAASTELDVVGIINHRSIISHFQPIFSVRSQKVVGAEALVRATEPGTDSRVLPLRLFEAAERQGCSLELDRLCRECAIETFAATCHVDSEVLVFVNLDVSILEAGVVGSNHLIQLIEHFGLAPNRVVIELIESKVRDESSMARFLSAHREYGFLIALDDVGAGHSNLDRILTMKPDIIKLDRSLVAHIDQEYYKQELFTCFMKLSHKLGIMVIAEGIETEQEALACLERGADLMQGYYFALPKPLDSDAFQGGILRSHELCSTLRERQVTSFLARKNQGHKFSTIAQRFCQLVVSSPPADWKACITRELEKTPLVECVYLLDSQGIQLSETYFSQGHQPCRCHTLFAPAGPGTDQSAKDYFMFLDEHQRYYVTEPYTSRATGNVCITLATLAQDAMGNKLVVCVDVVYSPHAS